MPDNALQYSQDGQYSAVLGGATTGTLATDAARLCNIIFTSAGTAALSIYDGTNQTAGKLVYTSPTNPTAARVDRVGIPLSTSTIFVLGAAGTASICVTYNKSNVNGK